MNSVCLAFISTSVQPVASLTMRRNLKVLRVDAKMTSPQKPLITVAEKKKVRTAFTKFVKKRKLVVEVKTTVNLCEQMRKKMLEAIKAKKFKEKLNKLLKKMLENNTKVSQNIEEDTCSTNDSAYKTCEDAFGKQKTWQKVGSGSFGTAYKVLDSEKKPMCLKIPKSIQRSEEKVQIENEHNILQAVRKQLGEHPTGVFFPIKRPVQMVQHDGKLCLASEFIDSPTIGKKGWSVPELDLKKAKHVLYLVHCFVFALCVLHELGVTHGDIKPDNMLWRPAQNGKAGHPVFIDYGFAACKDDNASWSLKGSPIYMAPELFDAGEKPVTAMFDSLKKADIFAFAMTLVEILDHDLHQKRTARIRKYRKGNNFAELLGDSAKFTQEQILQKYEGETPIDMIFRDVILPMLYTEKGRPDLLGVLDKIHEWQQILSNKN